MFQFAGYSGQGCYYDINQDCIMINGEIQTQFQDTLSNTFYAAVCDGVGGEAFGEIASRLAAEGMAGLELADGWLAIQKKLEETNENIMEKQRIGPAYSRMATTIAGIAFSDGLACSYNIGDSRVYVCHDELIQLSKDQTYLQERLSLDPDLDIDSIPERQRHVILNCLGRPEAHRHVEICSEPFQNGDIFLLSSDGMHDVLSTEDILTILRDDTRLFEKCCSLYELSIQKGSQDNISMIIVKVVDENV